MKDDDACNLNGISCMGDDPRTSVVDADCRIWDIHNLWILDWSLFPTVGGIDPSADAPGQRGVGVNEASPSDGKQIERVLDPTRGA
jgi:hypothetical protein